MAQALPYFHKNILQDQEQQYRKRRKIQSVKKP